MNKPLVGILAGAGFGFLDGLTSWFTPVARPMLSGILVGSSIKGMMVGIAAGLLARKLNSVPAGIGFGAVLGLILAYFVAAEPLPDGKYYYLEIMLPGFITGAIIGFVTQRYGIAPAAHN
jgi:hypothetical protein